MLRRLSAVLVLVFLSPLVAEYLSGSLPMSMIAILPIMAAMYGAGAVLIREIVRRTGRGWPSLVFLGAAYGVFEEGLVTQSLFNPNYLHLRLLDFGWIPLIGTGLPWLIYVVSIHVVWSICVPIGLTEALFRRERTAPWLGAIGLSAVAVIFAAGAALIAAFTYKQSLFVAAPAQLAATGAVIAALIVAAFAWAKPSAMPQGRAPHPLILSAAAFAAGSGLQLVERGASKWPWQAVAGAALGLEAAFVLFMFAFARGRSWSDTQRWALTMGALLVYVWSGFATDMALHGGAALAAHAGLAAALTLLGAYAGFRTMGKAAH